MTLASSRTASQGLIACRAIMPCRQRYYCDTGESESVGQQERFPCRPHLQPSTRGLPFPMLQDAMAYLDVITDPICQDHKPHHGADNH